MADIIVRDEGSIVLFDPQSREVREQLRSLVEESAQWFAGALVVEHRYAGHLWDQLEDLGFSLDGLVL